MKRRKFIATAAAAADTLPLFSCSHGQKKIRGAEIPSFLKGYEDLYRQDPRSATLQWFNVKTLIEIGKRLKV